MIVYDQPPLGGCVLKLEEAKTQFVVSDQPPLGGCVLKQNAKKVLRGLYNPAAFRRLCVETASGGVQTSSMGDQPPLGGCVLKPVSGRL